MKNCDLVTFDDEAIEINHKIYCGQVAVIQNRALFIWTFIATSCDNRGITGVSIKSDGFFSKTSAIGNAQDFGFKLIKATTI